MLFTPRLLLLKEEQTTTVRKSAMGQAIYVVPRSDCSFRRVRLTGTSREARAAAQLKARSEALPGENGTRLVLDKLAVSETKVAATNSMPTPPMASIWNFPMSSKHKGRYLPETLAQVPLRDGARVIHGMSGYEGQIWQNFNLVASRWWGRLPTDMDWDSFLRAAQESLGPLEMARPSATKAIWRNDLPLLDFSRERAIEIASPLNLGALIATGLTCTAFFIAGQYLRESVILSDVEKQAVSIRGETEQIQSERRRALTNMRFVDKYRQLGGKGTILGGLGAVADVIGHTDLGIEQMNLRNNELELRLKGEAEISVPDVVTALERASILSNVSISLETAGAIVIQAEISGLKSKDLGKAQ